MEVSSKLVPQVTGFKTKMVIPSHYEDWMIWGTYGYLHDFGTEQRLRGVWGAVGTWQTEPIQPPRRIFERRNLRSTIFGQVQGEISLYGKTW